MNQSKIDRIIEYYELRFNQAVDATRLELHAHGRHSEAATLASVAASVRARMGYLGTYERLELSDIIKGHKRAWPET